MVDLHNAGCTVYRAARILQIPESTVEHWAKGGEPGYGKGRAVLRLHAAFCGAGTTIFRMEEGEQQD